MNTLSAGKDLMKHNYQIKKLFTVNCIQQSLLMKTTHMLEKVFEELGLKNLGDYHDFYVHRDTFLLADVFENFRNKCIEIYELDPAHFLLALGLAWQACLKKTEVELELLTGIDLLLMVERGIRDGMCHGIHRYAKANNKYMTNYERNIESSYLMHLDANRTACCARKNFKVSQSNSM